MFIDIALHTFPIRGPLYMLYYSLFGLNPFPWHLTMYLTRLVGGIRALMALQPGLAKPAQANFFMAALFVLFPGFLWWVSGFEFQPYMLSVALQAFSIAFTLKAIASGVTARGLGWTVAAILSGWAYLALVEYAIGMEAFRLLCVYVYVQRNTPQWKFVPSVIKTLRSLCPALIHTHCVCSLVPVPFRQLAQGPGCWSPTWTIVQFASDAAMAAR